DAGSLPVSDAWDCPCDGGKRNGISTIVNYDSNSETWNWGKPHPPRVPIPPGCCGSTGPKKFEVLQDSLSFSGVTCSFPLVDFAWYKFSCRDRIPYSYDVDSAIHIIKCKGVSKIFLEDLYGY
ncbi:MAG: hypothetical protein OXD45_00215, partial [Rhodobacteraceae bacterium]|nr:hypothetical protein [Paracoccaceae bacterium]